MNLNNQAHQNCIDKLNRANERIVEFEDIKKGHIESLEKLREKIDSLQFANRKLREALEKIDGHALLADHSKKQYVWVTEIRKTCRQALSDYQAFKVGKEQ
jgi:hypothetical protein